MSHKPGKYQIAQPGSNFVLLLRRDNVPRLNFNTKDLSNIANLDMSAYEMPFNTVMPMAEFDTMRQVISIYNLILNEQNITRGGYPREISVGDIFLLAFKQPDPRWEFILFTPKFGAKKYKQLAQSIEHHDTIELGPGNVAGKFSLLRVTPMDTKHVAKQIARRSVNTN